MIVEIKDYDIGGYRKITAFYDEYGLTGISKELFEKIIIPALRKANSMTPIQCDLEDGAKIFCPVCGHEIIGKDPGKPCCDICGQAIDWSEDKE